MPPSFDLASYILHRHGRIGIDSKCMSGPTKKKKILWEFMFVQRSDSMKDAIMHLK